MKTYNIQYQSYQQIQEALAKAGITPNSPNILVQVFTSICSRKKITAVCNQIKEMLPEAKIIGATTAGEIIEEKIVNHSIVLSISVFEATTIKTAIFECNNPLTDSFQLGVKVANTLITSDSKVMILFSDGIHTNGENILKGIDSVNNQIIVAGGRAGDNGYVRETLVFDGNQIVNCGIVAAVLDNKQLYVQNLQSLCLEPIGKKMTVTRAVDDRVYTLDNINIKRIYKKYLGEEIANNLPKSATEFAFVLNRKGFNIARVAFGENYDEGLRFIGNIYEGEKIYFSYGNYDLLLRRTEEILKQIISKPVEGIFVFSCTVRKVFYQRRITKEISPLSQIANTSGFFTYGEFFHVENRNELLNLSTTILTLAENESYKQYYSVLKAANTIENFIDSKQEIIINAFTHLTNTVTKELDKINKNLLAKNNEYKKLLEDYNQKNRELQNSNLKLIEQQNKMIQMERIATLGQLVGGIAHNLKTPLMTSSGGILKLQQNTVKVREFLADLPDARLEEVQALIDDSIKWQEHIKKNLIYMADVINAVQGQAKCINSSSSFTIAEVVEKIRLLLEHEFQRKKCLLKFKIDIDQTKSVKGDINNLVQVLNNIVINALESYHGKGGTVELTIELQGSYIKFTIKDNGKGIPKEISRKIFKEMITTKGKNGSGLGLYISYLIIRTQFYGDIYFQDNAGKGTTFYILIPSYNGEHKAQPELVGNC